jgi:hypothetical protein
MISGNLWPLKSLINDQINQKVFEFFEPQFIFCSGPQIYGDGESP